MCRMLIAATEVCSEQIILKSLWSYGKAEKAMEHF